MSKTPALTPPPSETELEWWKRVRGPIRLKHGLIQGVPFAVVFMIVDAIRGRGGWHTFGLIPLIALLVALIGWAASEKYFRSQHIRWKRVRDDLGVPSELP